MRVIFCGLKNEYGKPELGPSFEYQNFFDALMCMEGVEASFFAIDEEISRFGRDEANSRLIITVEEQKPDLLFCFLFTEEIKKETITYITNKTSTKTFNWFADDHWRFPIYSRYWAPLFTVISTTDSMSVPKYKKLGINNVIKTQWAANTNLYKPQDSGLNTSKHYITFVGKKYGPREDYISALVNHNLPAAGYGSGWKGGRIDFKEMLDIFSFGEINLNFTESSPWTFNNLSKSIVKLIVSKEFGKYKFVGHRIGSNLASLRGSLRRQIKGRTFEVPACGGFLLTSQADNLGTYYEIGKEIEVFNSSSEMVDKCKFYLNHPEERNKIAKAGYERTLKDHTYIQRFTEIFALINSID